MVQKYDSKNESKCNISADEYRLHRTIWLQSDFCFSFLLRLSVIEH